MQGNRVLEIQDISLLTRPDSLFNLDQFGLNSLSKWVPNWRTFPSQSNGIMIKCHLGVISPSGLDLQYVYMAFDFHDVTTWAEICAFSFVSLSRYCPSSLHYSLLDLEDAVDLWSFVISRSKVEFGSVRPDFLSCSFDSTRNDRGLEGSVLPSASQLKSD
jgi:hypothetical protein